jgi:hypothetical protein
MAAPTVLTVQNIKGPFETIAANGADFTFAAGTITDGDTFVCTGREILLVKNGTGTNTITITSVDDEKGRAEDITTYSLATTEHAVFGVGLTNSQGWKSSAGTVRITVSSVEVSVAVLRLPAGYPGG